MLHSLRKQTTTLALQQSIHVVIHGNCSFCMGKQCQQTTITATTAMAAVAYAPDNCDHSRCMCGQHTHGRSLTCGSPPNPAMHVKLSSLDLNRSNSAGGVFRRGAGPGAVGSVSTPSAPSSPSKCAEIFCRLLRAAWICNHHTRCLAGNKERTAKGHSKDRMTLITRAVLCHHILSDSHSSVDPCTGLS